MNTIFFKEQFKTINVSLILKTWGKICPAIVTAIKRKLFPIVNVIGV